MVATDSLGNDCKPRIGASVQWIWYERKGHRTDLQQSYSNVHVYFHIILKVKCLHTLCFVRQEDSIRIEEITNEQFIHDEALKIITSFTEEVKKQNRNETEEHHDTSADGSSENTLLQRIVNLPRTSQICFATLVRYLKDFKLEGVMKLSRLVVFNVL
jgi:hypothetical protein